MPKKNKIEEVPLEYSDEETDVILAEEGSLDGDEYEVAEIAAGKTDDEEI